MYNDFFKNFSLKIIEKKNYNSVGASEVKLIDNNSLYIKPEYFCI